MEIANMLTEIKQVLKIDVDFGKCKQIFAVNFDKEVAYDNKKHEKLLHIVESYGFELLGEDMNYTTGQISLFVRKAK